MRAIRRSIAAAALALATVAVTPIGAQAVPQGGGHGHGHGHGDDMLPGVGELTWGACENPTLVAFGAECAMLTVPLDYRHPDDGSIELAVSRLQHTVPDEEYQGIMLVNPGGPGGSGLIYSVLQGFVPDGVGGAYDWIGFDPRGVGSSLPALSCIPDYFAGPRPDYDILATPGAEQAWLERSEAYADACGANGGELLDHVRTTDTVMDMHAIRQALGEDQLSFYGFSYGTYLAQVYATLYPDSVYRMVLDSSVDPRKVWYEANLGQDYAFEEVFQLFFEWVAGYDDVYQLGTTGDAVEAAYYTVLDQLRAEPIGILGPAELPDAYLVAGYLQDAWPDVAAALSALAVDGDAGPTTDLYLGGNDTTDDNGFAMYLATECTDARWPGRWSQWKRDAIRVDAQAPFLTWDNTWFNAPCLYWPARSGRPVNVRDKGAPPILIVGETLDAATPFSGNLEVRRRFRDSVVIGTEGGTTHANSLFGGNACVDDAIAAYLLDGTLPDRQRGRGLDVVCEALPLPTPDGADTTVAGTSGASVSPAVVADLQRELVTQT